MPDDERCQQFADYLLHNYVQTTSRFQPEIWACFTKDNRTTNACESFHSRLSRMFYSPSPNIFVFTENLRLIETEASLKRKKTPNHPNLAQARKTEIGKARGSPKRLFRRQNR
ncbi:gamma-tubulin complex component [Elysia marginata]|uniref:Gamma-tubulin complex component n=1 Tax=Elysia marginata TaxID=1093978 RepID=A0AAV4EQ65_9GAST|nr:gamma-tubulin complex component [Elysia marginata]